MSPLAVTAILLLAGSVGFLVWSVAVADVKGQRNIRQNLGAVHKIQNRGEPAPSFHPFLQLARKTTPTGYAAWLDRKLAQAGRPRQWPLERLLSMKPALAVSGALLGLLMVLIRPAPPLVVMAVVLTALGYFLPDILVSNTATKRREAMQLALPAILDQMMISVEAGVGFEQALGRAAENSGGPLADEFVRTLQDLQVGRSRHDAYTDLARRAAFPELRSFIRAVIQADQYGIGIAGVLRTQAQEMRVRRRQRAEEHAMKIPVKILFPLIFAILPALFIIVLGPALIGIVQLFQ